MKRFLVTAAALLLAACAARETAPTEAGRRHAGLLDFLGTPGPAPMLLDGTVTGPDGEWGLTVRYGREGRMQVQQDRATGATVFGRAGTLLWRTAPGAGEAARLPDSYAFFFDMHRVPRLAGLLADWELAGGGREDRVEGRPCRVLAYIDTYARPVEICIDPENNRPLRITLSPPDAYGAGTLHVLPDDWHELDGYTYLLGYRVWHAADTYVYAWQPPRFPGPGDDPVTPPPGLFDGGNGAVGANGGSVE